MGHLIQALTYATHIGRDPHNLSARIINHQKQDDGDYYGATISGGSDDYTAEIVVAPNPDDSKFHCDCHDFRFTFYPHIQDNGLNIGEFPPYVPNGRGAPRAAQEFGMCKHLMCLVNQLAHDKILPQELFMKME
jgi:hypothetical protein